MTISVTGSYDATATPGRASRWMMVFNLFQFISAVLLLFVAVLLLSLPCEICGDSVGFLLFSGAGNVCAACTNLTVLAFPAGYVRALRFVLENVTGPFLHLSLRCFGFRVPAERASVFC